MALLALACTGCGHDEEYRHNFDLPQDLRALRIRMQSGEVAVAGHSTSRQLTVAGRVRRAASSTADQARLDALPFELVLRPTENAGTYELRTPALPEGVDRSRSALVFRAYVSLPDDIAVDVEVESGNLSVQELKATVRLHTGRGELSIAKVEGDAELVTGDGKVYVQDHRGGLSAESGDPTRTHLTGEAIWAKVLAIGASGIRLRSNGTSIALFLPSDAHFDLDAEVGTSQTGKLGIRTGFGVPVHEKGEGHVATGPVGGGGPPVVLRLVRGWLSVGRISDL